MTVGANKGGLNWIAGIDTSKIQRDAERMAAIIENAVKKSQAKQKIMVDQLRARMASKNKNIMQDAMVALEGLSPEMQKQVKVLASYQAELNKLNQFQATLNENLKRGTLSQNEYAQASAGVSVRIAETNEAVRKYSDQIKGNRALMNAEKGSIDEKRIKLQQLTAQYNALSAQERNSTTIGQKKALQIRQLDGEISRLNRSLRTTGSNGRIFNQLMATTVGLLSVQQVGRLAREIVRVRGEIQQLEVAFETILKSKAKAEALMGEIIEVATTTPFKLTEVADATKQLLAYGFAQNEIKRQLLAIGNVASGVGSTFQEVAYAYGTLRAQGRAFQRDIRQFTTRGIPIIAELANVMGVAEEKVQGLVSAGKVGFPEVEKAFANMTSEGGMFFELMEKQSQTVTGEIAKLQDRIQLMFNEIGEDNQGFIKNAIKGGSFLVENYESVSRSIVGLIAVYGTYRTALILNAAATKATGSATLTYAGIIDLLQKRLVVLKATMATMGMLALAAASIALVITSLMHLIKTLEKAETAQQRLNKVNEEAAVKTTELSTKIQSLVSTIQDENNANAVRAKAYEELKGLAPEILKNLTFEESKNKDLTRSVYEYIDALNERIRTETLIDEAVKIAQEKRKKEAELLEANKTYDVNKQGAIPFSDSRMGNTYNYSDRVKSIERELENIVEAEKLINEEIKSGFTKTEESIKIKIKYYKDLQEAVGETSKLYDKYQSEIENLTKLLNKPPELPEPKDKAFYEQIIKDNQEFIAKLNADDADFLAQKQGFVEKINEAQKKLDLFAINETKEKGGKTEKDLKAELLKELAKMEDDAFKKSFDKKEQELGALLVQLANFKEKALAAGFTEEEANKLLGNFKNQRSADISYRAETEDLKIELERQKALYEDYEEHIREFGIQSAEKKYGEQLDLSKSYLQNLLQKYNNLAQISPDQLLGPESERFAFLEKLVEEAKRKQEEIYEELLIRTQDYETKRSKLIQQYVLERKKLREEGNTNHIKELDRQHQLELDQLDLSNIQKLDVYQRYFNDVDTLSNRDAKERLKLLKAELIAFMEVNEVSDAVKKDIENVIRLSESDIDRKLDERVNSIAQNLQLIAGSVGNMNAGLANSLNLFSNILRSAVQVKQSMEAMKLAKDAKDSFGMLTAGFGIAGAAISGGMMIANYFRNIKAQNAELEKQAIEFQNKLIQGELRINKILKDRAVELASISGQTLVSTMKKIDLEQKNIEELTKKTEGYANFFLRKFGGNFEAIERIFEQGILAKFGDETVGYFEQWKAIREQIEGSEDAIDSLNESLKDMLLGGQEWSGIADTIIQGFQDGKRAVQDFGDDMEDIIRKSLLSGFKYRALEQPIQKLLDDLFNDARNGEGEFNKLNKEDISRFQQAYGRIVEEYGRVFEDLQNATGINLGNISGEASSLKNSIRRELTEQTASELAGIARSNYDLMRRQFNTAIENLHMVNKIEQNTFQTVVELRTAIVELKTIAKNTKPPQSARDNGLGF